MQARGCRITAGIDHIEPASGVRMVGILQQEDLRGMHQFVALACIDRPDAAAECSTGSIAHFDKNDRIAIPHHQVDFAAACAGIARQQLQAMGLQVRERGRFDCVAACAACRYGHAVIALARAIGDGGRHAAGEA